MAEMNSQLVIKVLDEVRGRFGTSKTRNNNTTLQGLVCPACGDGSAWCYLKNPWAINCNRSNECGVSSKIKDLFPELFQGIEKLCPPVPGDPERPARVFLETRGIQQAFIRLDFAYWRDVRKSGSGAVMFPVGKDDNGKLVYNGRLFNPQKGEGKTHNSGSTSGRFWFHPGRKFNLDEPIYVTEGIINALSLIEAGYQAISVLASGQDPSKLRLDGFKNLVTAFDNDKAGIGATRRWAAYFKNRCSISAVLPDKGKDWNDHLMDARGESVKGYFEKKMPEFTFNAKLALSVTAQEYLDLFLEFKGFSPGLFDFKGCYHYAKAQHKGESFFAVKVSDFTVETDFYLLDDTIKDRRVYRYGLTIHPQGRKKIQAIFEAKEIATSKELSVAMLARGRCSWSGDAATTSLFCSVIVQSGARELRQLQALGYDEGSNHYIFPEFMIDPSGKMVLPENGLFSLPGNQYIRPSQFKTIVPVPGLAAKDLWSLLLAAWGNRAAVAVAWTVSSWFVDRVRAKTGFFPFLSLYHDPQTGKSALMRCLNRMQGVDEEGLAMTKADTIKGLTRKLSQKAALFTGLSEVNKDENTKMPIDSILAWYDGSVLSTRAAFTGGNEVVEIPFKSSVMFCQNVEPFLTTPQKERVVSLRFEKERLSPDTGAAFIKLMGLPIGLLANFFIEVIASREVIEKTWFDEFVSTKKELYEVGETSNRLIDTHGLVLAFHRLLCRVIGINYDLKPFVVEIMNQKSISSQDNDYTAANTFFAEVASILRESQINHKRGYCEYIDFDANENTIWVCVHDLVNMNQPSILSRYPIEKTINALKIHPSFIRKVTHRFKYYKADSHEQINKPKNSYCFNLGKVGDEFDFDLKSIVEM